MIYVCLVRKVYLKKLVYSNIGVGRSELYEVLRKVDIAMEFSSKVSWLAKYLHHSKGHCKPFK